MDSMLRSELHADLFEKSFRLGREGEHGDEVAVRREDEVWIRF